MSRKSEFWIDVSSDTDKRLGVKRAFNTQTNKERVNGVAWRPYRAMHESTQHYLAALAIGIRKL